MDIQFWGVLIIIAIVFHFIEKRLNQIEKTINTPKDVEDLRGLSYQATIRVEPEWTKIIRHCFPDIKTNEEAWEFIKTLTEDLEEELDKENCLYHKGFTFIEFYDAVSGLNPIWSVHHKNFVEDAEIWGHVFENSRILGNVFDKKAAWNEFSKNKISRLFVASPSFVGFTGEYQSFLMTKNDKLAEFPYYRIIQFLGDLEKNSGWGSDKMIKTFPEDIQKMFSEKEVQYNIEYNWEDYGCGGEPNTGLAESEWLKEKGIELFKQTMKRHVFETPYFSISIKLKSFSPEDR